MRKCFQVTIYKRFLRKASLILKTLLGSQHIKDDLPNGTLHTGFIMIDKAEPAELTEL